MRSLSAWTLLALLSLLAVKGLGQDLDLFDALAEDDLPAPTAKPKPKEPAGGDLDLSDGLDVKPTPKPKEPVKPKPKPNPNPDDIDLADALDPSNDIGGKGKDTGKGEHFDLMDNITLGGEGEGDADPSVPGVSTATGCEHASAASSASVTEDDECECQKKNIVDEVISVKNELRNIGSVLHDISLSLKELVKK